MISSYNKRNMILSFIFGIIILVNCLSFISAESGMVVFQNSTAAYVATPQYKLWNESVFGETLNATPVTGTLQWNILKNNPIRNETILGTLDSNSDINVQFYNSSGNWGNTYTMTSGSGVNTLRAYYMEAEQLSGDVMVAYNNGSAGIIGYQVWNGSNWYKSGNLTTNLTGQVNWIKMASDKKSNRIMLVAGDANARLTALVWNGTNWSSSVLLETVLFTVAKENFDVAFEDSGDALLVWAETVTAYPKYITYSNNSWGVEGSAPASSGQAAGFQWFRLANYPNTDRIMSCYVDSAADFNCAEWTGSGWGSVYEITAGGEYSNGASFRNFDVVPDTSSQSFFLMYALNNEDYYRTIRCFGQSNCQSGIWEAAQTFLSAVDIGTDTAWAHLSYDPENTGKITAIMMDQSSFTPYIARISCSNSANSCAADQTSTLLTTSSSSLYESAMFAYKGRKPTIQNISTSATVASSSLMTISANNVNDTNENTLNFYCSISSSSPTASNTICTGGTTQVNSPYTGANCSYTSQANDGTYTVYCRVYDGDLYSTTVNTSYIVSSSAPTTSVVSVAGDTTASYFDTVNDGATMINISGETGMSCRWASTDLAYSGMGNTCTTSGIYAGCNITGISSEGFYTRYVACQNSLGIGQNASQNLDVGFYLDYTAPTTSDNSDTDIHAPNYLVTITEGDAVDSDPTTYYCTSSTVGCNPTTAIDNNGIITYTSSNRGVNYLRYYSIDDALNSQIIVNKTININYLPVLTNAVDNATTIKGGRHVNVSTNSSDADSSQNITLYVCNSSGASASGCTNGHYCNATGTANLSCQFASELDTNTHIWYAYIFDSLNESASANPLTGSYATDYTAPVITIINPIDNTNYTQNSITAQISLSETGNQAWYSLNNGTNTSMLNSSGSVWYITLSDLNQTTYTIRFYANDSFGNIASSNAITFSIVAAVDTAIPSITITSPNNNTYVNATNLLINITTDEALNWASYQLNSGSILNMSNDSSTNWYKYVNLSEETMYNLTIYANDTSNNQANKTYLIYSDSLSPRYYNASANPNFANQSQNVNCSINWSDGFNISNVIIGENSSGSFENHTISFSGINGIASYLISGVKLANIGTYTCRFYATDAAGNTNSTSITFVVNDTTNPIINVLSPTNATYNQENFSINIISNENLSSAKYSLNGAANVTMGNTSGTNWNSTLTGLSNGNYNIVFYGNDTSNNLGNSSIIYFTINTGAGDTTGPAITINTISNLSYYTSTSIALNITTSENSSSAWYKINSGSINYMSNSSMINWNATLSSLGNESTNILEVYANDTSNNIGNSNITFYVDNLKPRMINQTAIPSLVNETQSVLCNIYVNDTFRLTSVKIEENATTPGIFMNHSIDINSSGYANYTITNLQKGNYTCLFYATDAAGNTNSTSTTFYVNDTTAPIISINSPLNSSYPNSNVLFSISSNENLSTLEYTLNEGVTNTSLSGSARSFSDTVTLTNGNKHVIFYGIDTSGNIGNASVYFTVDTSVNDITPPTITFLNPNNNSYSIAASNLLRIISNENLSYVGYSINGGSYSALDNATNTDWNKTITLSEGENNISIIANDSSSNKNSATPAIRIYVDLTNPLINGFSCNDVNDSDNVICYANLSDSVGLDYAIISYNATGTYVNTSQISLNGLSHNISYTINAANTTPGNFDVYVYVYDDSGRANSTSDNVLVRDDSYPGIYNITYQPNTTDSLDPGITLNVNASILENYNISNVTLMYRNSSNLNWNSLQMSNLSEVIANTSIVYNASIELGNETWYIKINATDAALNSNISSNYTLYVDNDTSFFNSTTIEDIESFTLSQANDNNLMGYLFINNTGDNQLNFSLNTESSIGSRININGSGNSTSYVVDSGNSVNLSVYANTTSLPVGLYNYNITIMSSAGTTYYIKRLNIQNAAGPYLVTTIDTYSSLVTRGQSAITFIASVKNLGTSDGTGVSLNWTIPSIFSLTSGSLTRDLGNLPVGSSSTNSITIGVSSSATESSTTINASANSNENTSASDSKSITIIDPLIVVQSISTGGGGSAGGTSGGGGGAGAASIIYNKIIEFVRGKEDSFNLEIYNPFSNSSLSNITINFTGILSKYIKSQPIVLDNVNPKERVNLTINLKVPSYRGSYEEQDLKAYIGGERYEDGIKKSYNEIQNVLLVIQEISREDTTMSLEQAQEALRIMSENKFNTKEVQNLIKQAQEKLEKRRNKEAFDFSQQILQINNTAFSANDLILRITEALDNPKRMNLISGNAIKEYGVIGTGKVIFDSQSTRDILDMANAAFERGDYKTSLERAKQAQVMLVLERKGNFALFIYLYWYFIIIGFILLSIFGIVGYKSYQKTSVSRRIGDMDKEEDNVSGLIKNTQKNYFSGKISEHDYYNIMIQHQNKISEIRKDRTNLRSTRIKLLKEREVVRDLDSEKTQVENLIKKLQSDFYVNKKISENEYRSQFQILNERLAEIEGERSTYNIMEKKNVISNSTGIKERKGIVLKTLKIIKNVMIFPFQYFKKVKYKVKMRDENHIKSKIKEMLDKKNK